MYVFSFRQGTHRDSFTLFAERVKKFRRKRICETEDPFNLSLVTARGHRHSLIPQGSVGGGITITTPPPQANVSPSFRMFTAPASYRQNHSLHGGIRTTFMGGGGGGSPAATPIPNSFSASSLGGIAEDGVRVSPPTVGHTIYAPPFARVELVRLELPSLGSEFKGRAEFVDEVIASLDEMQEVYLYNTPS